MTLSHQPVLFEPVLAALAVKPGGCYVDGTFGRGGHSAGILNLLGPQGQLLAFDRDPRAIAAGRERFAGEPRLELVHAPFATLRAELEARGRLGRVDGLLLDLGVSSPQLDDGTRGFSFLHDGPLDMRMDPSNGESAASWLARSTEADLRDVLRRYGEVPAAGRIARAVVAQRAIHPFQTTAELAGFIAGLGLKSKPGRHPATQVFQALRLHINDELGQLQSVLGQAVAALAAGGRLAVISFHSLEDRIVKRFMRDAARGPKLPRGLPVADADLHRDLKLVGAAVRADAEETKQNPRARSAVLRVAERLA